LVDESLTVREERGSRDGGTRCNSGPVKVTNNNPSHYEREKTYEPYGPSNGSSRPTFSSRNANYTRNQNWRSNNVKDPNYQEYEKRAKKTCYVCHSPSHFQANCPKTKERNGKTVYINRVEQIAQEDQREEEKRKRTDDYADICRIEKLERGHQRNEKD
jgi:hypothetical protein